MFLRDRKCFSSVECSSVFVIYWKYRDAEICLSGFSSPPILVKSFFLGQFNFYFFFSFVDFSFGCLGVCLFARSIILSFFRAFFSCLFACLFFRSFVCLLYFFACCCLFVRLFCVLDSFSVD